MTIDDIINWREDFSKTPKIEKVNISTMMESYNYALSYDISIRKDIAEYKHYKLVKTAHGEGVKEFAKKGALFVKKMIIKFIEFLKNCIKYLIEFVKMQFSISRKLEKLIDKALILKGNMASLLKKYPQTKRELVDVFVPDTNLYSGHTMFKVSGKTDSGLKNAQENIAQLEKIRKEIRALIVDVRTDSSDLSKFGPGLAKIVNYRYKSDKERPINRTIFIADIQPETEWLNKIQKIDFNAPSQDRAGVILVNYSAFINVTQQENETFDTYISVAKELTNLLEILQKKYEKITKNEVIDASNNDSITSLKKIQEVLKDHMATMKLRTSYIELYSKILLLSNKQMNDAINKLRELLGLAVLDDINVANTNNMEGNSYDNGVYSVHDTDNGVILKKKGKNSHVLIKDFKKEYDPQDNRYKWYVQDREGTWLNAETALTEEEYDALTDAGYLQDED